MELEILYNDGHLVAINKPHGMLTHRSPIANDCKVFAMQTLRNQLKQKVRPLHRLDRKTGGLQWFALDAPTASGMQRMFAGQEIDKTYWAIVRGFTDDEGRIDYPLLKEDTEVLQQAVTEYKTLRRAELPIPQGKFATSRYSLVEAKPKTGRMHQIRKHFAHIFHPVIADRPHGCNKQNKFFLENWGMGTMLLHSREAAFAHPLTGAPVWAQAEPQEEFKRMLAEIFGM